MRTLYKILTFFISLLLVFIAYYFFRVRIPVPVSALASGPDSLTMVVKGDLTIYGDNWIRENDYGIWEMYIQGKPFERGVAFGKLTQELNAEKEAAFVKEIRRRIPSPAYFSFLKYLVGWFNRDLENDIPQEFQEEIYGSSLSMSDDYDNIAPKFHRSLNYHAAHDIGHALQNLNMVGCTSFAVKNDAEEGVADLVIGRNFDFYFGEEFAKDKIVAFVEPDSGYNFMSVTWAGFCGVVSGMNDQGLTVTLNSAKSEMIFKAKTPVSIIGRHILQYAATIDEAFAIASSYDSFVSETFLIGSAKDNKAGLIEKSKDKTALFTSDEQTMIVTNHFQSDELKDSPANLEYMQEGVSQYRYKRVEELLSQHDTITAAIAAFILRDNKGLNSTDIGLGNEKAINQLIAHHSVIFAPHELKVWVSAPPYQLGKYLCYDLKKVFALDSVPGESQEIVIDSLSIAEDEFLKSEAYVRYLDYTQTSEKIKDILYFGSNDSISSDEAEKYLFSNPKCYLTYYYLGDYYLSLGNYEEAKNLLETGLTKEIARKTEKEHMEKNLNTCNEFLLQ
jgi:hypothetical protein